VSLLALPLTAVLTLHLSPGGMGLLTAAGYAPHLLFSLLAGGWIDRSSRRRLIMITADVGRAVVVASVPLAVALGVLSPAHLYLVGAVRPVRHLAAGAAHPARGAARRQRAPQHQPGRRAGRWA